MADLVFIDKAGRSLQPGDLIIYGHGLGRCAALQYGKVIEIVPPRAFGPAWEQYPRLRVQGVDAHDNWLGYPTHQHPTGSHIFTRPPELRKKALLYFPSRVLRVARADVPPALLALLDTIVVSRPELPDRDGTHWAQLGRDPTGVGLVAVGDLRHTWSWLIGRRVRRRNNCELLGRLFELERRDGNVWAHLQTEHRPAEIDAVYLEIEVSDDSGDADHG